MSEIIMNKKFFLKSLLFSFPSLKKAELCLFFFVLPPQSFTLNIFFLNFFVVRNFLVTTPHVKQNEVFIILLSIILLIIEEKNHSVFSFEKKIA